MADIADRFVRIFDPEGIMMGNCLELSEGFYGRLLRGSESGKLLAKMVDWIYELYEDKEREDIDMISGIIAESIAEMVGCEVDFFVNPTEEIP